MRKSLLKKINNWEKEKIITTLQKKEIIQYEDQNFSMNYLIKAITYLSLICIGLGIISIISANWQEIPDSLKLIIDFSVLFVSLYALNKSIIDRENKKSEYLVILNSFLILATIGLVGQIYQLQGELVDSLLFWSILTLPFLLFTQIKSFPLIWTPICVMSTMFSCNYLWGIAGLDNYIARGIVVITLNWCLYLLVRSRAVNLSNSIKKIIYLGLFVYASMGEHMVIEVSSVMFFLVLGVILVACLHSYCKKEEYEIPIFLAILWIYGWYHIVPEILVYFIFIICGICSAYKQRSIKWINILIILAAIRIFIEFCEFYLNLMTSGIGLVGLGVGLIIFIKLIKAAIRYNNRSLNLKREK